MSTWNHYEIEYAGPRRKTWKRKLGCFLWELIGLLIGVMLLWGLFAQCTGRGAQGGAHGAGSGAQGADAGAVLSAPCALRAGFGVPDWVAYGIVGTVVLGILGQVAWKAIMEGREADTLAMPPEHDPLEEGHAAVAQRAPESMPAGLARLDAATICFALASEVRLIRELVRGARSSHSVEDCGDALAGAERRLGELRTRLWQLKAHFDGSAVSVPDEAELPLMPAQIRMAADVQVTCQSCDWCHDEGLEGTIRCLNTKHNTFCGELTPPSYGADCPLHSGRSKSPSLPISKSSTRTMHQAREAQLPSR